MVGRKIGQFQIVEELGVGGMGTVYKARDTRLNRFVAIKALHPHVLRDSKAYRRFRNEAQISAQLSNPNVATLYDFIKEGEHSYLIMEYIDGETIECKLKREGALSVKETIGLATQILKGLAEAHRLNILHRDLKPANVMIKAGNYAKLMDFGIARLESATRMTAHNKVIGTVEYMAPELLKGKEPSKASDLYAVGVMIYEMLTGKTLFVANSEAALIYSIVNEKPTIDLSGVPTELKRIIKKLTNRLPQHRYHNTSDVLKALEKVSAPRANRQRPILSLPSKQINWPKSFSLSGPAEVSASLTKWISQWQINKKAGFILLGSIIVSLFIVFAGSFSQPSLSDEVPEILTPTPAVSFNPGVVPEAPRQSTRKNDLTVQGASLPTPPARTGPAPITIEKKEEPATPTKKPKEKEKPDPPPARTTAPVNITHSATEGQKEEKLPEHPPAKETSDTKKTIEVEPATPAPAPAKPVAKTAQATTISIPQQYLPLSLIHI